MGVKLNSSGGGSVTVDAPVTANNYTLTLAASSGTVATLASVTNNGVVYVNSSGQPTSGSGLVFDSSGNLGLGVTPSAWVSAKAFQVGSDTSLAAFGNETELSTNAYWASGSAWKYIVSSRPASQYTQYNGTHVWSYAPSGTAGNAISFTQAMTLDASGNLGVGTTSALTKLTVSGGYISQTDGTINTYIGADGSGGSLLGTTTNHYLRFVTNNTERMRIDSSGNVLINTTNAGTGAKFFVYGTGTQSIARVQNPDSFTGGANFTTPHLTVWAGGDTTGNVARFAMTVGSGAQVYLDALMENSGSSYSSLLFRTRGADSVAERMRIDSSGNLKFNSGYGSVATAYGVRAWVNFNGTGTPAINASGNVSSITDTNVGRYVVNFSTAMPDGAYAPAIAVGNSSNAAVLPTLGTNGGMTPSLTVNGFNFGCINGSGGFIDPSVATAVVSR